MREKITFMPEAPHLPSGTITFLFTDIEGSTRLWEQFPVRIGQVMTRHDELIESLVEEHHGVIVRPRGEGDSRFAVFSRASEALAAADKIQRAFSKEPWDLPSPLKVRIAIHTGEANLRDGDYYGAAVNRCARLRTLAHGGQILLSQTTRSLVNGSLPKGMNLHDLGEHKLKDLKVPERIYQLIVDGLPTDFPPLRGQDNSLTNFPVALTSFIGRDHELAEVERLLTSRRLLTITGPGGSGKTRLALQAGTDLINSYPHGVWLVDLSPLSNPSYITSYFMSGLGIREEVNYAPIDTLVDFMKDKTLLILLDNCEHVLQEAAQLVGRLLQSAPNLTILATSRAPLGFQGEMVWCIPPLSTPKSEAENTPEELMKYESVRLFVERAVISRTGFHLTKSNARAVAQICIRLDGIPLAIELAAARVKVLSVEDIAARLDDRFRLLVSHQNAIPRQKTLQNLIDWSYDLLPEKEQELLQRLSVFAGGWTLSAAEEVCSGGILEPFETLDLLSYLVDKSLVIVEFREESERYHLLETIRQYAQKRLAESQDKDNFSHKHASYFTSLAQEAYGELWGSRQVYWLDRLETEHDNLRTAMKWMDQTKDSNDMLLRMAASLWRFWEIHGYLSEGRAWLELALEHCPRAAPSLRAHGLRGAGELALQQGDYERATDLHQQSLALFHEIDDKRGIGRELAVLGEIAHHQGEYSRSIGLHEKSLALRQEIGDKEGIAASLGQLGMIARDQGQYQSARELLEESLRLSRELEDKRMTAYALKSLGLVAFTMCEYPLATRFFEEAVSFYRELNDRLGISDTLQNLGNVAKDQGYFQRAADLYAECLQLKQELGDRRGVAQAISGQAEVDFYQGIYPRALELVEQGLDLFRELGVKRGIILCLGIQSYIAHYQGNYMLAHTLAHNGMDLADEIGAPRPIAYAKEVLGLGAYVRGDLDEAKSLFQEAMLIFQKINDRRNFASLMVNLARTAYRQGNRDKAWHYLRKSRSICQELEIHWTKSFVLEIMGLLEREAGHYDRAMQLILESLHLSTQQANQQGIANCLGALAGMAALLNQPERAARLFAATEKLRMEMGAKMGRDDQREYERYLSMLRDQMDPGEFEAAWSEGSFMTTEEIIGDFKVFGGESALSHTNFKSKNPHRTTNHDRGHAGRAYAHRVRPCTVPGPPEVAEPGHIS